MKYQRRYTPEFEEALKKIKKKDQRLFERLTKKIEQIMENPEHYKPSRYHLKGTRHALVKPFIILFDVGGNLVSFHFVKHHDRAF